jgi:hypothetical protein
MLAINAVLGMLNIYAETKFVLNQAYWNWGGGGGYRMYVLVTTFCIVQCWILALSNWSLTA